MAAGLGWWRLVAAGLGLAGYVGCSDLARRANRACTVLQAMEAFVRFDPAHPGGLFKAARPTAAREQHALKGGELRGGT